MKRGAHPFDVTVALLLFVAGSAQLLEADHSLPAPVDLLLALALTGPLAVRRRWPVAVLVVVTTAMLAGIVVEDASADLLFMPPLLIASYSVGSLVSLPRALVAPLVITAMFVGGVATGSAPAGDLPVGLLLFTGPWLGGQLLRVRDRHVAELTERAVRAEAERDREAADAVTAERARIARELHDVVSHSISVVTIQVQAVRRRLRPDQTAEAADLAAVETTARQAMVEMRRMLGVLRATGEPTSLAPQPGLGELDRLIAETRATGVDVRLEVLGERTPLSPSGDTAAYRIVQEALTNVRKHAGGAACVVRLDFTGDDLRIAVVDDGARAGHRPRTDTPGGHGLAGMRERAALYGGAVTAGPRSDGPGFEVRATLPIREGAPA